MKLFQMFGFALLVGWGASFAECTGGACGISTLSYYDNPSIIGRAKFLEALSDPDDQNALHLLRSVALSDENLALRKVAIASLGRIYGTSQWEYLEILGRDVKPEIRIAVGDTLKRINTPSSLQLLAEMRNREDLTYVARRLEIKPRSEALHVGTARRVLPPGLDPRR